MRKSARVPSSEPAKRIAAIFHRQLTTKWSEKEVKKFRELVKDGCFTDLTDLGLIERCYRMQWPPNREKNILRHDLYTFLNHFQGETDRARIWCERHPEKPKPRKVIPMPPVQSEPLTAEERADSEKFMAQYLLRKREKPPETFQDVKRIMEA